MGLMDLQLWSKKCHREIKLCAVVSSSSHIIPYVAFILVLSSVHFCVSHLKPLCALAECS